LVLNASSIQHGRKTEDVYEILHQGGDSPVSISRGEGRAGGSRTEDHDVRRLVYVVTNGITRQRRRHGLESSTAGS
jgi:hypothetical protein